MFDLKFIVEKVCNVLLNRVSCDKKNSVTISGDIRFSKVRIEGSGNSLDITGGKVRNLSVDISGDNNRVKIAMPRDIRNLRIIVKDYDNLVDIGKHSGIANSRIVCCGSGKRIRILPEVMIADNCEIWNCDTHSILSKDTGRRLNPAGNIDIGSHVWLGRGVSVFKDVTIGDGCIAGACSMLFKGNYDSNAVYVGSPALLVRDNIEWCIERL